MKKSVFTKTVCAVLFAVMLLLCSCGLDLGIQTTADGDNTAVPADDEVAVKTGAYNGMFDGVMSLNITMGEAELSTILDHADAEMYCECSVDNGKETLQNVGIKPRGNTSHVTECGSRKYSFKLKFNKYTKGQKLNGLDEMYLNNMSYDPSYCREYIAYALFSLSSGISAPLASFAKVYINGEYYGLYLAVEAVDESFLKREFGNADGNLYEANRGSAFISDDTSTFTLECGNDTALTKISKIYNAISDGEGIEEVLDVESVLRYAAVIAVVCGQESYLGAKAENYYFYEDTDGVAYMIPWDLKTALGVDLSLKKSEYSIDSSLISTSVTEPYFGLDADDRPLVSKLLANEKYYKEYLSYVEYYRGALSDMLPKLSEVKKTIDEAAEADENHFFDKETYAAEFTDGENTLYGFIKSRCEHITSQLAAAGE